MVDLGHRLRCGLPCKDVVEQLAGHNDLGLHGLTAAVEHVQGRGFFVHAEIAGEGNEPELRVRLYDFPDQLGGVLGHPVHSHGVAGLADETNPDLVVELERLDAIQPEKGAFVTRDGFEPLPEPGLEVFDQPPPLEDVGRFEKGGPAHAVACHHGAHPAGPVDRLDPSLKPRHQGRLVGGARYVVLTARSDPLDLDRPGYPQRNHGPTHLHLDACCEALLLQTDRVYATRLHPLEPHPGPLLQDLGPHLLPQPSHFVQPARVGSENIAEQDLLQLAVPYGPALEFLFDIVWLHSGISFTCPRFLNHTKRHDKILADIMHLFQDYGKIGSNDATVSAAGHGIPCPYIGTIFGAIHG